ncbi:MAG: hypothetical protein WB998_12120 [Solirubrobacteraceae bacterium]
MTQRRRPSAIVVCGGGLIVAIALALPSVCAAAAPSCPTTPPVAPAKTAVPPELLDLTQKTTKRTSKLTSIRISFRSELETETGDLILEANAELRLKPREASNSLTIQTTSPSSRESRKIIEIGDSKYTYEPSVTRGDGGRPWVREAREQSHKESGMTPFEPSPKLLGEATSIVATGATTLDGQEVRVFTITYAPQVFPESEIPFGELIGRECQQPVQVTMAFSASGLPAQVTMNTSYVKAAKTMSSSTTTRILATNFRFKPLSRPSARQTITEAALRRFEQAKLEKELAKHRPPHPKPKTL